MDPATFYASLSSDRAPPDLTPPLVALWHAARGEWDTAHGIAQRPVCLVRARGPLHREAPFRLGRGREAVRVYAPLELAVARLELGRIERVRRGEAQQLEVVAREGRRQTLNDSPHPQRSFSLGLLNLKPSLRPSRTKSSSVPSR